MSAARSPGMLAAQAIAKAKLTAVEGSRPKCAEGGVLLKTNFASICGSDLHLVYCGLNEKWPTPALSVPLPCRTVVIRAGMHGAGRAAGR